MQLHWDGNNTTVQERNKSAAFGTGTTPPTIDIERIKRVEMLTFAEHFAERLPKMNWHRRAAMWSEVVGRENFSVRLLDKGRLANGDLLDDFCAVAGLDRTRLETPPRMNESLSAEEIALLLRIGP